MSSRPATAEAEAAPRNPIRETFPGCCARAEKLSAKMATSAQKIFLFIVSSHAYRLMPSLNDFVRPRQHIGRDRQADLLGRFQIDNELELLRLLDGEISRLGTFQDFIHVDSGPPVQVGIAHTVAHEPS